MIHLTVPTNIKNNHVAYLCENSGKRISLKNKLLHIAAQLEEPETYKNKLKEESNLLLKKKKTMGKNKKKSILEVENYKFIYMSDDKIKYASEIVRFIANRMEILAVGNISDLNDVQRKYEDYFTKYFPNDVTSRQCVEELISNSFLNAYDNFSSGGYIGKDKIWNRIEYVKTYDLNVCPYCNAQFILTIKSDNQEEVLNKKNRSESKDRKRRGTSPELDHFLPKHKNPLFSMSAYNLVPSCKVCNQSLKGEIDFNYEEFYSPFEDGIEDSFRFYRRLPKEEKKTSELHQIEEIELSYENSKPHKTPDYVNSIFGISEEFTIGIKYVEKEDKSEKENQLLKKKVNNNVEFFRLEEIYNFHKKHLQKMLFQSQIYNELYKYQLEKEFPKLFTKVDEITNMITSKEAYKDVILSKMVSEIIFDEIVASQSESYIGIIEKLKYLEHS